MPPIPKKENIQTQGNYSPQDHWTEKKIQVTYLQGGKSFKREVTSICKGPFAIHAGIAPMEHYWIVTSITTGLMIAFTTQKSEAKKLLEFLLTNLKEAFSQTTEADIQKKLPAWVQPWIMQVRERKEFVEIDPANPEGTTTTTRKRKRVLK